MPRGIRRVQLEALHTSERFAITLAIYSIGELCKKVAEMLDPPSVARPVLKMGPEKSMRRRKRRRKANKNKV